MDKKLTITNIDSNVIESLKGTGRTNMADDIFERLKDLIISGKLKPGTVLPPEIELAEYMKVGRSTLRESLRALTVMGLVVRTKRGTFVNDEVNMNTLLPFPDVLKGAHNRDVQEFRKMLEIEIAELAAERADDNDIENLCNTFREMTKVKNDIAALTRFDALFHVYLAAASHNELLQQTYEMVRDHIEGLMYDAFANDAEIANRAIDFHEKLLQAIKSEDATLARSIMCEHMSDVDNIINR